MSSCNKSQPSAVAWEQNNKTMKKYFFIQSKEIPLYRGKLVIILSNDKEKIKNICPIFDDDNIFAHAIFGNYKGTQGFFIILNHKNKYMQINPGVIAHEAHHICSYIADKRGIIIDTNNDEPMAYLIEWIVNEVHKYITHIIK